MPRPVDPSTIFTGAGSAIPGSVSQSSLGPSEAGPASGPLDAHLSDPSGAHPASSISIQDLFERYLAGNVEGALGELAALVPPAPGVVGSSGPPWLGSTNTGVPDWGVLKLWDGALSLSTVNFPDEIYPYYWRAPLSTNGLGTDPVTDPVFNVPDTANTYTGGGIGLAHAGFATVSMGGGAPDAYPSWRSLPALAASTVPDVGFVVSGIVSPADRGVLALVRWFSGDTSAPLPALNATAVLDRCVAALLLGRGIADGGGGCDGTPGGLFSEGTPTPYAVPGRASGQYELDEYHTGVPRVSGTAPALNKAAGQVRLLTDPSAVTFSPATVAGGMPILGATSAAINSGGTDGNFFAYRLPYLKDYSTATGLIYTDPTEKPRFFSTIAPALTLTVLDAGDYADFTTDFWAVQIARYRHRVSLGPVTAFFRQDNSFALVHFKREQFFEDYVRDGIIPTSDKVYSVNLVNWNGVAQLPNLVDVAVPGDTSPAYPVNASELLEDPNGSNSPALAAPSTFTLTATDTTLVSGVSYYVPLDPLTGTATAAITSIGLSVTRVFDAVYRSHDTNTGALGDDRDLAVNQNPLFLSVSPFSYEGTELPDTSTITLPPALLPVLFPGSLGGARRQRLEFGFSDLTAGVTNPALPDLANVLVVAGPVADRVSFQGDEFTPAFTTDAKVRAFVRRPLVVDGGTGYPLPADPIDGFALGNTAGKTLFHSMKESNTVSPVYGNAATPAPSLYTPTKDREERFLDEVYRYPSSWASSVPLPAATLANLTGPGLPSGLGAIAVPVRPTAVPSSYEGYYLQDFHLTSLTTLTSELQVAGLPERNPPYTDGLDSPFPSRGILIYPQVNYVAGHDPAGPDYSGATGDRLYLRVFDGGATNVGSSTVTLRFLGVTLADFAFVGFGPGGADLALVLKVPGLTAWLDIGRVDGAGPSKQDPALDGAGCKVVGPNTFDAVDPGSKITYAQVEVNLGPLAPLFLNGEGKCPLIVGVLLRDTVTARALNWANVAATGATNTCRGLVGIEVVVP